DDVSSMAIEGTAPWSASYTVPAIAAPGVALEFRRPPAPRAFTRHRKDELAPNIVRVDAARDLGDITVELLDHHFVTMQTLTVHAAKGRTEVAAPATPRPIESLAIKTG